MSSTSVADFKVAAMAFGFTIGFGFLTTWEAIKQTRRNRNPLRSTYIYMVWGEIIANLCIGILGWLWIDGIVSTSVPLLFFILFFWVFEVQLLMQIIVNRIAIIAESRKTITRIKWGTAAAITLINVLVFCIFIPAHSNPPVSQIFVDINKYWDRTSKFLIMAIDAVLNWYFLRVTQNRLVKQHNLKKYQPLVSFNAKLMIVSIAMDAMLIGLMWLPNQTVFIQFHPITYMVKLNIEMSMASLITRLASRGASDEYYPNMSSSNPTNGQSGNQSHADHTPWAKGNSMQLGQMSKVVAGGSDDDLPATSAGLGPGIGIHMRTEVEVRVESDTKGFGGTRRSGSLDDEYPLTSNAGHPKQGTTVEERSRRESSISRDS